MGQLLYRAFNVDAEWLKNNDFIYSRAFSDDEDRVFIRRFAAFKWGSTITLEAEMRIHSIDNSVTIDVYDRCGLTRGLYAPFYYESDTCHRDFVEEIVCTIDKECKKLGFEKIEK